MESGTGKDGSLHSLYGAFSRGQQSPIFQYQLVGRGKLVKSAQIAISNSFTVRCVALSHAASGMKHERPFAGTVGGRPFESGSLVFDILCFGGVLP